MKPIHRAGPASSNGDEGGSMTRSTVDPAENWSAAGSFSVFPSVTMPDVAENLKLIAALTSSGALAGKHTNTYVRPSSERLRFRREALGSALMSIRVSPRSQARTYSTFGGGAPAPSCSTQKP